MVNNHDDILVHVIFINYLPNIAFSTVQIFTGGAKIYRTVNDIGDAMILQEYLSKLQQWSSKW